MNEQILHKYFNNQATEKEFLEGLLVDSDKLKTDYTVTRADLIKLCDLVLESKLDFDLLGKIAFQLIGSDYFDWDSNDHYGEIVSNTIFDWDNPEINYPLTKENIQLWKQYLLTGKYRVDKRLIYIELETESDGHIDLIVELPKMNMSEQFDSYYFQVECEPFEISDIKQAISNLIEYWKVKILEMKSSEPIYLPIDFSDEYIGCYRLESVKGKIKMQYGFSRTNGFGISPSNSGDFYKSVKDFELLTDYLTIEVSKKELIDSLIKNINDLRKNVG
jgi:hypothetical protein